MKTLSGSFDAWIFEAREIHRSAFPDSLHLGEKFFHSQRRVRERHAQRPDPFDENQLSHAPLQVMNLEAAHLDVVRARVSHICGALATGTSMKSFFSLDQTKAAIRLTVRS